MGGLVRMRWVSEDEVGGGWGGWRMRWVEDGVGGG